MKESAFFSYIIGALQKANRDSIILDIENEDEKRKFIVESKGIYDFIDYYNEYYRKLFVSNIILGVNASNLDEYLKLFSDAFAGLMEKLNIDKFYFALSERLNWFYLSDKIKTLKGTYNNLTRITNGKKYFDAFEADKDSIKEVVKIIFFLARYAAFQPYVHILSEKIEAGFNICKYGNLHIEIYNRVVEEQIKTAVLADGNLKIITEEVDFIDDYGKRKIVV